MLFGMSLTVLIPGVVLGVLGVNIAVGLFGLDFSVALRGFSIWMGFIIILSVVFCRKVESWAERHLY